MYLGIRTDSPAAEFYIYESTTLLAKKTWQADRELALGLIAQLETFLSEHGKTFTDLTGLFAYRGPGSFTGLRIGLTVLNTAAYAQDIPIAGATGDDWQDLAVSRLAAGENDRMILPSYGAEARITKPRK